MNKLEEAVEFVRTKTLEPVYSHPATPEKLRFQTQHTEKVIRSFKRIGDLVRYMKRFKPGEEQSDIMKAVREAGVPAFEDIYDDFLERYGAYEADRTRLSDFVVGEAYTTWDLVNFAELYNTQTGGILLVGPDDNRTAILLIATLDGSGDYPNEWIEPGTVLRYYMMGRAVDGKKVFKPTYKVNRAVIESGDTPILVFDKRDKDNILVGIFRYDTYVGETNGDMWFRLVKREAFEHQNPTNFEELQEELARQVQKSKADSAKARKGRLKNARKKPHARQTIAISYERNPDVIVEVLDRASGICERCHSPAPFIRKKDDTPYLEVHHKITLAGGGEDTVENAIALCPNCHRELHFGIETTD